MKCWVEGSECGIHNENCESGVLNITEGFCRKCYIFCDDREVIGEMMKFPQEERLLSKEDEDDLYDKSEIILEALDLLRKKQKKKIMKANNQIRKNRLDEGLNDIKNIMRFFKKLAYTQE